MGPLRSIVFIGFQLYSRLFPNLFQALEEPPDRNPVTLKVRSKRFDSPALSSQFCQLTKVNLGLHPLGSVFPRPGWFV